MDDKWGGSQGPENSRTKVFQAVEQRGGSRSEYIGKG